MVFLTSVYRHNLLCEVIVLELTIINIIDITCIFLSFNSSVNSSDTTLQIMYAKVVASLDGHDAFTCEV